MRFLVNCVQSVMIPAVAAVFLVGTFIGCGSGRDSLVLSGAGGSAADAQPDARGGRSGSAGQGGEAGMGGGEEGGAGEGGGPGAGGGAGAGGDESGGSAGSGGEEGTGGSAASAPIEPPSCQGLLGMCGTGVNTSCCLSTPVKDKVDFRMGRSNDGKDKCPTEMTRCESESDEQPEHVVTVSEFNLDVFEVTVGRFRKFVDKYQKPKAGAGVHPRITNSGWQTQWDSELPNTADDLKASLKCNEDVHTWRDTVGDTEQHPINCVSWYEAFAFCAWDGGRLPTEAEWEKAAAASGENRLYPWGQEKPNTTRACFDNNVGPMRVGLFPLGEGGWGHQDLAGNLWEWVLDWYDKDWYDEGGKTCNDCANLKASFDRVMRGGAYSNDASYLRAAERHAKPPMGRHGSVGFRCARDP